jgi:hypothetical protein
MEVVNEILIRAGYSSNDEVLRDNAFIIALTNIEKYKAEYDLFKYKHHMDLIDFEKTIHGEKGVECFEKEQDYEDWEFAFSALKWWELKMKELKNAKRI